MISYPKKVGLILPSVESWGTNNNILRDPPKSITTRRVDKPLMTSDITEMIDGATDRASECINVYARGVNPSVSVNYTNIGNNGAGRVMNGMNNVNTNQQPTRIYQPNAALPYQVLDQGAFRPPVRTPYDLLPLSRLPRAHIYDTIAQPSFTDWFKSRALVPDASKKVELKQLVKAFAPSTKITNVERPFENNFKMNDNINEKHINVSTNAGISSLDKFEKEKWDTNKHAPRVLIESWADTNKVKPRVENLNNISLNQNDYTHVHTLKGEYQTNQSSHKTSNLENMDFEQDKYLHDTLKGNYHTNYSSKNHTETLEGEFLTDKYIQNPLHYEAKSGSDQKPSISFIGEMGEILLDNKNITTNVYTNRNDSRINNDFRHENEIYQERNMPITNVQTEKNYSGTETFSSLHSNSREFRKVNHMEKENFLNRSISEKPYIKREGESISHLRSGNSEKQKMMNFFNDQQFNRITQ